MCRQDRALARCLSAKTPLLSYNSTRGLLLSRVPLLRNRIEPSAAPATADDALARAVLHARRRLGPFLLLMYVIAFLDRANIGFAKQALQSSRGITEPVFAWGAGLFFLTYALFEVPSNLILHRVGARIWMCRIMVTWGVISTAMMFVRGPLSYETLRLLLGLAEAGFFPGVIFYLTYWFPNQVRGQVFGQFYFGAPLAFIFGGPLSGLLLAIPRGSGLEGWQWMFLVEGSLAVLVGIWAWWYLADTPRHAHWLSAAEKAALEAALAGEEHIRRAHGPSTFRSALADRRVLHFAAIYFLIQMSVYGVVFFLPATIAGILRTPVGFKVGVATALPWTCALIATWAVARLPGRARLRRYAAVIILVISGLASAVFLLPNTVAALTAICVAAAGFIAVQPLFWTFPANYLSDRAAAGGIALVNALGSLGGFVAPNVKVWADHAFHSPAAGLSVLAGFTLAAAVLVSRLDGTRDKQSSPLLDK